MDLGRRWLRLLLGFLLLCSGACEAAEPATEVLVEVRSDLEVGTELTKLRVEVWDYGRSKRSYQQEFRLAARAGENRYTLPFSYSLFPVDGATSFRLVVIGIGKRTGETAEGELVTQQALARFTPRQTMFLPIRLEQTCVEQRCAADDSNLTCRAGTCESAMLTLKPAGTSFDTDNGPVTADGDGGRRDSGNGGPRADGGMVDGGPSGPDEPGPDEPGPDEPGPTTPGACMKAEDCQAAITKALPQGCAIARCNEGSCVYEAADVDMDGHKNAKCQVPGMTLEGDDCDDYNNMRHPGAWDGPAVGDNPARCDQHDDNCNGELDDSTQDGASCACDPSEVNVPCSESEAGEAITWPAGTPVGSCKYGTRSCVGGKWSACVGAVPPKAQDACTADNDDSCDGKKRVGCECQNGMTQPCGSAVGSCETGTQTCVNGKWSSECVGAVMPAAKDSCVRGNDDTCNGKANEGCDCIVGAPNTTCGQVGLPTTGRWGDCPSNVVKCVNGKWDLALCTERYTCDQCTAGVCGDNGSCQDQHNDYRCVCNLGYDADSSGKSCIPNPCELNPCANGGCQQVDQTNDYICRCNSGYQPSADNKSCVKVPVCPITAGTCANGTCVVATGASDWSCKCDPGFNYDAATKSCVAAGACNGAVCIGGTCTEATHKLGYDCKCPDGMQYNLITSSCELKNDLCEGVVCGLGGTCSPTTGKCVCSEPLTTAAKDGKSCVCQANADEEAGACVCAAGRGDCDPLVAGCETNLRASTNCGECGIACEVGVTCRLGVCIAPVPIIR